MVRPSIRTNYWLSAISGVALLACLLSSPSGSQSTPGARARLRTSPMESARPLDGVRGSLTSSMPGAAMLGAHRPSLIEGEDEKSSSPPPFVSPVCLERERPSKLLPGSSRDTSPSPTVVVPLRC